jgi:Flp pilus assembly protein TadG
MPIRRTRRERGFVLITMALGAVAIFGAVGMAVDVGRAFIAKNETQVFCDAASLAATVKLDGTSTGITKAKAAVTNSTNAWNMATAAVASPTVDFATSASGPWVTTPSPASGYIYTRVQASVNLSLYFVPVVLGMLTPNSRYTQTVNTAAISGQIPITSFHRGLAPYTAISTQPTAPGFGLVVGNQYDIQWPAINAGGFVRPPCSGEPQASKDAVLANWSSDKNGYWGDNASSVIYQEVLDNIQPHPIFIGQNIYPIMTSGNKNAQATALDTRVQQDGNYIDNVLSTYLADPLHNGRRFIALPVVDPTVPYTDPTGGVTSVLGYASFFLLSDGGANSRFYQTGSGNEPFCAVYAGPYVQGSADPGAVTGAGAYRVALVQ